MNNSTAEIPSHYWRIEEWFPDLGAEVARHLKSYSDELLKHNKTGQLISSKTVLMADALHFADSILACRIIMKAFPTLDKIFDFGAGAGFPGLVLAILYPQVHVSLVDSDVKKCDFLKRTVETLKLSNISVLNQAFETLPSDSVQFALTRGSGPLSKNILLARKCVRKGGVLFHLKGEEWSMEVSEIPTQLCSVWSPSLAGEYKLPVSPVRFAVVQTDKIS